MRNLKPILIIMLTLASLQLSSQSYKNFSVAIYCRAYEVEKMADLNWLSNAWDEISKSVHVDKIYLETHRDLLIVSDETLEKAKKFFNEKGVEVGGGITYTIDESNNFQTFCYTKSQIWKRFYCI